MKVIILGAGKGTRLGSVGKLVPKLLIEMGGDTILGSNLRKFLSDYSIEEVRVVTGWMNDKVKEYIGSCFPENDRVVTVFNPDYEKSVIYSVRRGLETVGNFDRLLLVNGDTFMSDSLIERVVADGSSSENVHISIFGCKADSFKLDDVKLFAEDGLIRGIGKKISMANAVSAGAVLMDRKGFQIYNSVLMSHKAADFTTHHAIINQITNDGVKVAFSDLGGRLWKEIDTIHDIVGGSFR